MKLSLVFLVLSMVVMMAEPGEGIFGLIAGVASGIGHAIHGISNLIKKRRRGVDQSDQDQLEQQQLDKLLFKHKLAENHFN
uniref:Uncharacterized protein n=1 Tax=Cyprinodon variegatus TaxID=28743 RepID=A0A3Q2DHB7_CYPVA